MKTHHFHLFGLNDFPHLWELYRFEDMVGSKDFLLSHQVPSYVTLLYSMFERNNYFAI